MAEREGIDASRHSVRAFMHKVWSRIQQLWKHWKPFLSLLLLAAILAFLGHTLYTHWHEVSQVQVTETGWACLTIATGITLFAHIWTGWVWGWILQELGQPISRTWASQTYLKTNIAKYLPGNVLHLYGRAIAAKDQGAPFSIASLSVLLDTLLMAAGGVILGLFCIPRSWIPLAIVAVGGILLVLHPNILGPLLDRLSQLKKSGVENAGVDKAEASPHRWLKHYPLGPLLGEMLFVALRGLGFVLTVVALTPISLQTAPTLISIFSVGWVLGFVTPGAPGGLGVFELTVSTLLTQESLFQNEPGLSVGVALSAVALNRLVSTLAEVIGALLAFLDERWTL
jgi:glycosyltransferase 2 family protein